MVARYMPSTCVYVCVCVTCWYCIKTAKPRITQITIHDRSGTLVFWCQRSRRNLNGVIKGSAKCRWGRLKSTTFDIWMNEWINFIAKNNTIEQHNIIVLTYNTMALFCNKQTAKQPRLRSLHLSEAANIIYNASIYHGIAISSAVFACLAFVTNRDRLRYTYRRLSRFSRTPTCDGRMDGQTDIRRQHILR